MGHRIIDNIYANARIELPRIWGYAFKIGRICGYDPHKCAKKGRLRICGCIIRICEKWVESRCGELERNQNCVNVNGKKLFRCNDTKSSFWCWTIGAISPTLPFTPPRQISLPHILRPKHLQQCLTSEGPFVLMFYKPKRWLDKNYGTPCMQMETCDTWWISTSWDSKGLKSWQTLWIKLSELKGQSHYLQHHRSWSSKDTNRCR